MDSVFGKARRAAYAHPAPDRRHFVGWLGGTLLLTACGGSPQELLAPLGRSPKLGGTKPVSVLDYGAVGDGITDDTNALQAAIDALGPIGGSISIPAGTYLVDPLKSVRLADNVSIELATDTVLKAKAVSSGSYSVMVVSNVRNVSISGGSIIGDRTSHLGTAGEWGMGIRISGASKVRVENVTTSDCWGDGIYVGASSQRGESTDVTIKNCRASNNRRQGISITGCVGAIIENTALTDTNGTSPECGIDLEPNGLLRVSDIVIRNCTAARNEGYGFLLIGKGVTNVTVTGNESASNALDGVAVMRGASECQIDDNFIHNNQQNGILLQDAHSNGIVRNTIRTNRLSDPKRFANVMVCQGSSGNSVLGNIFGTLKRLYGRAPQDIVETADCHDNTIEAPEASTPSRHQLIDDGSGTAKSGSGSRG